MHMAEFQNNEEYPFQYFSFIILLYAYSNRFEKIAYTIILMQFYSGVWIIQHSFDKMALIIFDKYSSFESFESYWRRSLYKKVCVDYDIWQNAIDSGEMGEILCSAIKLRYYCHH